MMEEIYDRSLEGKITKEDALKLVDANHFQLFDTADRLRQEIVVDEVSFVANRNIDITDHCIIGCAFCSFRDNIGYEMTTEEILENIKEAVEVKSPIILLLANLLTCSRVIVVLSDQLTSSHKVLMVSIDNINSIVC